MLCIVISLTFDFIPLSLWVVRIQDIFTLGWIHNSMGKQKRSNGAGEKYAIG